MPILRALAKDGPVGMVHFDAHTDTWNRYFGDNLYTHGTPFRRAIEEGLLDPKRTIQIGIRGALYNDSENDWGERQGIRVIDMDEFRSMGVDAVIREASRVVGNGRTYVTFDVDALDPRVHCGWHWHTGYRWADNNRGPAHDSWTTRPGISSEVMWSKVSPPFDPIRQYWHWVAVPR
ncbi:arginase family protein [Cupriavidus basilensis]